MNQNTAMPQSNEIPPELLDEMTPAVRAFVTQILARLSSLEARLEASERRVAELEKENRDLPQRLAKNSSNSSLPPSSDRPEHTPPKTEKTSTGRKRGGQAGHVKRESELIPTGQCDMVEEHVPRSCSSCGGSIHQSRSRSVVHATMGDDYRGVVTSDRFSAYSDIPDGRHHFCWAHLIRDFRAMVDQNRGTDNPQGRHLSHTEFQHRITNRKSEPVGHHLNS